MGIFVLDLILLFGYEDDTNQYKRRETRSRGYKRNAMLNSAEHEIIFPPHKCSNDNKSWHFNTYEHEK